MQPLSDPEVVDAMAVYQVGSDAHVAREAAEDPLAAPRRGPALATDARGSCSHVLESGLPSGDPERAEAMCMSNTMCMSNARGADARG